MSLFAARGFQQWRRLKLLVSIFVPFNFVFMFIVEIHRACNIKGFTVFFSLCTFWYSYVWYLCIFVQLQVCAIDIGQYCVSSGTFKCGNCVRMSLVIFPVFTVYHTFLY